MKILIVTQAVDRVHPILGFFHRWIEEFARQCDSVTVIGQQVGDHALPDNVRVLSLGKEEERSRLRQILRFWMLQWELRHQYDVVFVHMTPVWMVLGTPIWLMMRKHRHLWYEARRGGWMLRGALLSSRRAFSATQEGIPFPSLKKRIHGHGIDTSFFSPSSPEDREAGLLVAVGRITPIKHIELFIDALAKLPSFYRLLLIGIPFTEQDHEYLTSLWLRARERGVDHRLSIQALPHVEMPFVLRRAVLFLHAGGGGLDKALLEAMSCECLVLSASQSARSILPSHCTADPHNFSDRARALLSLPWSERLAIGSALREQVQKLHSLPVLIHWLIGEMGGCN